MLLSELACCPLLLEGWDWLWTASLAAGPQVPSSSVFLSMVVMGGSVGPALLVWFGFLLAWWGSLGRIDLAFVPVEVAPAGDWSPVKAVRWQNGCP